MPKGYLVANIRVTDAERFQEFSGMAAPAIKKYGGKVLARGPLADRHEGDLAGTVMMPDHIADAFCDHSLRGLDAAYRRGDTSNERAELAARLCDFVVGVKE